MSGFGNGKRVSLDTVASTIVKGMAVGAPNFRRRSLMRFEWDVAGRCQCPFEHTMFARPSADDARHVMSARDRADLFRSCGVEKSARRFVQDGAPRDVIIKRGGKVPLELTMWVPCGRCPPCLRAKARRWRERGQAAARALLAANPNVRVWWCTYSFSPENHYRALVDAEVLSRSRGVEFAELSLRQQRRLMEHHEHGFYGVAFDKYFKRLRKGAGKYKGAGFVYLLVSELHRGGGVLDGKVHYHALLFETDDSRPLLKAQLKGNWWGDEHGTEYRLGHCRFKLLAPEDVCRTVGYICKYITKDADARVRASKFLGNEKLPAQPGTLADRQEVPSSVVERGPATHEVENDRLSAKRCDLYAIAKRDNTSTHLEGGTGGYIPPPPLSGGADGPDENKVSVPCGEVSGLAGGKIAGSPVLRAAGDEVPSTSEKGFPVSPGRTDADYVGRRDVFDTS